MLASREINSRIMPTPSRSSRSMVVLGSFPETTILLPLSGETTSFAVFVNGVADPVDTGVAADGFVRGAKPAERTRYTIQAK